MTDSTPKSYHTDPALWLYTSLTAGSSHIITATSRLETILKANQVPFKALDVATDEKARMLWGRRAGKRKLPGLVRMGMVVGDLEEVEEWNEYGEIKQNLIFADAPPAASTPTPSTTNTPSKPPPSMVASSSKPSTSSSTSLAGSAPAATSTETPLTTAMRQASLEAAAKAKQSKAQILTPSKSASEAQSSTFLPGASSSNADMLSKLDNSAPGGALPPTGTSEAEEAVEPMGKMPRPEESKAVEESSKIAEAPEEEGVAEEDTGKEVVAGPEVIKTEDATPATDKAEELPGTRTQEQEAGVGEKVGESVAD
ncbi:hypothetical protein MMC27_002365 [Xylographa pallens]|nr:hypothetical protein [Xylographa pallens]